MAKVELISHPQFNPKSLLFMSPMSRCHQVQMHSLYMVVLTIVFSITRQEYFHPCWGWLTVLGQPSITASWTAQCCHKVMGKPFEKLVVNVNKTSPQVSLVAFVFTLVFSLWTDLRLSFSEDLHELTAPSVCACASQQSETPTHNSSSPLDILLYLQSNNFFGTVLFPVTQMLN